MNVGAVVSGGGGGGGARLRLLLLQASQLPDTMRMKNKHNKQLLIPVLPASADIFSGEM